MLYKKFDDDILLRCLSYQEADEVLKEMHDGVCGAHQPGPKLQDRIRRMGYYWPTMVKDAMEYARRFEACQFHANFIHQAPEPLHPTVASWPFEAWGMDIIGPINPPALIKWTPVHPDRDRLLLQMGRSHCPGGSQNYCTIYKDKRHL